MLKLLNLSNVNNIGKISNAFGLRNIQKGLYTIKQYQNLNQNLRKTSTLLNELINKQKLNSNFSVSSYNVMTDPFWFVSRQLPAAEFPIFVHHVRES